MKGSAWRVLRVIVCGSVPKRSTVRPYPPDPVALSFAIEGRFSLLVSLEGSDFPLSCMTTTVHLLDFPNRIK